MALQAPDFPRLPAGNFPRHRRRSDESLKTSFAK